MKPHTDMNTGRQPNQLNDMDHKTYAKRRASVLLVALLAVLLFGGCAPAWEAIPSVNPSKEANISAATQHISAETLESAYGLRVQLLAVTAMGGMVDLRLRVVDAAKAEAMLADPAAYPTLRIGDGGVTLTTSEENRQPADTLKEGALLIALYPNLANAVTPGTPVTVVFGAIQLEPIDAI